MDENTEQQNVDSTPNTPIQPEATPRKSTGVLHPLNHNLEHLQVDTLNLNQTLGHLWNNVIVAGTLPRGDVGRSHGSRHPGATPTPSRNNNNGPLGSPNHYTNLYGHTANDMEVDDFENFENERQLDVDPGEDDLGGQAFIWGTNISTQSAQTTFRHFLDGFQISDDTLQPFYHREMDIMRLSGNYLLNLNCQHLKSWPATRNFYTQLLTYPHEIIPIMDGVMQQCFNENFGEPEGGKRLQVRTYNLDKQSRMRDLDPNDIDKLMSIKGMVIRVSSIIPDLKQAFFRCFCCHDTVDVMIHLGRIEEPPRCTKCNKLGCLFTDKQMIRLQETPDEIPEGETPYTITLFAFDDLVDTVRPGDRIEITGIFRAIPRRPNPKMRTIKSIYKTYIDAIHFRRADMGEDKMLISDDHPTAAETVGNGSGLRSSNDLSAVKQFSDERVRDFKAFVRT
eukprot:gene29539-36607_t